MRSIDFYLALPWTTTIEARDDDGHYLVIRIAELDGFVVAGRDEREVGEMFLPALRAFILTYLDDGREPPLPGQ